MNRRRTAISRVGAALVLTLIAQNAKAQSTIFNIPSTDTVDKGKTYLEFDSLPQTGSTGANTFIYNPRIVVGLPRDAEFGVNVPIVHNSDFGPPTTSFAYIQPNVKWKFFKAVDKDGVGAAADVGVVVNAPLNARHGQATWSYVYGSVSKKWKGDHGPRATIGPYGVIANQDSTKGPVSFVGRRGGVIAGYEQPLSKTVAFVADWFSGQNNLGYFTPGVSVTLPHNGLFNVGYSFGNDSLAGNDSPKSRNRYLFFYYGVTFNALAAKTH